MSYLSLLKARMAERSAGSVGDRASPKNPETHLPEQPTEPTEPPFEGFVGDQGGCVFENYSAENGSTAPPFVEKTGIGPCPTKPTKATECNLAMRRALLRNDLRLFDRQVSVGRCWVCQEFETVERPLVPILSASPGEHHWLHLACHAEHIRRIDERVEALLAEGFDAPF